MNIRGTDATALAAANDLFAVTSPMLDKPASDFSRALQGPARSDETPSSRRVEYSDQPDRQAAGGHPKSAEMARFEQKSSDSAEEDVAVATSEKSTASNDADEHDVAAESLNVASTQSAAQKTSELDKVVIVEEEINIAVASEAIDPAAGVEQLNDPASELKQIAKVPASDEVAAETPPVIVAEVVAADAVPIENELKTDRLEVQALKKVAPTKSDSPANGATSPVIAAQAIAESADESSSEATSASRKKLNVSKNTTEDAATSLNLEASHSPTSTTSVNPQPGQLASDVAKTGTSFTESSNTTSPAASSLGESLSARSIDPGNSSITHTGPTGSAAILNRLPAHALAQRTATQVAGQSAGSAPVTVDAARFLQRVVGAFESARDRGGEIRLRLSPPELGALRVEVSMHESGLVARVSAETPDARAILLENLPALRERLAEQGLRLERFDVDLLQQEPNQQGRNLPDQSQQRPQPIEGRPTRATSIRPPTPEPPRPPGPTPITDWQNRRLNVIV